MIAGRRRRTPDRAGHCGGADGEGGRYLPGTVRAARRLQQGGGASRCARELRAARAPPRRRRRNSHRRYRFTINRV